MDTFELLEELSKKPKEELKYALLALLLNGKIDFTTVNAAYIQSLEHIKEDSLNQLIEAETCVMEALLDNENRTKHKRTHIQRWLYLLNKSRRFNMQGLNDKYGYNEEEAKEYSWYERNKKETF